MGEWGALIRDNHEGYITWTEFEAGCRPARERGIAPGRDPIPKAW
jgi:hypothetical protein